MRAGRHARQRGASAVRLLATRAHTGAVRRAGVHRQWRLNPHDPKCQPLLDEHRQALLGHGRHRHQPHVPRLLQGRDYPEDRRRRIQGRA